MLLLELFPNYLEQISASIKNQTALRLPFEILKPINVLCDEGLGLYF